MQGNKPDWGQWQEMFRQRSDRPLPQPAADGPYASSPVSLARSLAIFQLGESGGGTIVEQARRSRIPAIDARYADAMALFVEEEHRHADILAVCVRLLGGSLIHKNWTATLFVASRRLIGLRLKVLVLLAAEVVGICYYHLLASRLPPGRMQDMLQELVADEQSHLQFHCCFLRSQTRRAWRRALFVVVWRATMLAAAISVLIDHRPALRDMGIEIGAVWRRWMAYSRLAERCVTSSSGGTATAKPRLRPVQFP